MLRETVLPAETGRIDTGIREREERRKFWKEKENEGGQEKY